MHGRIRPDENENLKTYLCPDLLTNKEEKIKEMLQNWREEVEDMSSSEEGSESEDASL